MLEVISVSRVLPLGPEETVSVLEQVSFSAPSGHLMAIVGAPGSGKTALLEILAGLVRPASGNVFLQGVDFGKGRVSPNAVGYVPASDEGLIDCLTVRESLRSALVLRVAGLSREEQEEKIAHLLVGMGLETVATQRVQTLSLPQRRRLKLALALVSDPALVICDEFTSGLDVRSERELAALLSYVAQDHPARVVIHATRTLGNLSAYDTTILLHERHLCFHGPARALTHYFSIESIAELYPRLAKRPAQRWADSWGRHRDSYYQAFKLGGNGETLAAPKDDENEEDVKTTPASDAVREGDSAPTSATTTQKMGTRNISDAHSAVPLPSLSVQARHLLQRRWIVLKRTRREWISQLALTVAAPLLTAALVLPNMRYVKKLIGKPLAEIPANVLWPAAYTCTMAILIQVLFVLVMAIRNGSREIAKERPVYERERVGGIRRGAYLLSKLGFITPLVLFQCFTLGIFVESVTGGLPGNAMVRIILFTLTGLAFSIISLGISAHARHPERAHSQSWMLLFVNLLLAGALLAFPSVLNSILSPLSSAYYGWAGSIETMTNTAVFEPITRFVRTPSASLPLAVTALFIHCLAGVALIVTGLRKRHL